MSSNLTPSAMIQGNQILAPYFTLDVLRFVPVLILRAQFGDVARRLNGRLEYLALVHLVALALRIARENALLGLPHVSRDHFQRGMA